MDNLDELKYDLKISINYHRKRERFYRTLDATSKAMSLTALAAIGYSANPATIIIAGFSGALTIATVVIDCPKMASRHNSLAVRFSLLLSKAAHEGESHLAELRKAHHIIEADEPPVLPGLAQICQDEEDYTQGRKLKGERFSMFRRLVAHLGFGYKPSMDDA